MDSILGSNEDQEQKDKKPEGIYGNTHRLLHGDPGPVSELPHDKTELATFSSLGP